MSAGTVPFGRFFPRQGIAQTRVLTTQGHPVVPDDEDAQLELVCAEPGCDCRRVMLNVIGQRQQDVLARIRPPDAGSSYDGQQDYIPALVGAEKEAEVRACR